jgi:hypothetical protein
MGFFEICLEEVSDSISEQIRYNAMATRASTMDESNFNKFIKDEIADKKAPLVTDHEANIRKMQGK